MAEAQAEAAVAQNEGAEAEALRADFKRVQLEAPVRS